jgi:serpin B
MASVRRWFSEFFSATNEMASFPQESDDFALAMYAQLGTRPGNLFFSPFNVRTVLAMAYAGAKGSTADQMREALRISVPGETLHADFGRVIRHLRSTGSGKWEMDMANSLWSQAGVPLRPEYLELMAQHYDGNTNLVDFRSAPESARAAINQWIEEKTRQRIRDLIPPGTVSPEMRLILASAVYFKGTWALQFHKPATRSELFRLEGGGNVRVNLMYQQDEIRYMEGAGYQAVELAYLGGGVSMLVLLPDERNALPDLEKKLSSHLLHDCVAKMEVREVKVFLPQFKITWGTDLTDVLSALGMPLAFSRSGADFSGINGYEPPSKDSLFLSAVQHKAFVEVNEEGTEAAAATAAHMELAAMAPPAPPRIPVFRADHPFLFAIRDRESGAIVFLGRMANPALVS